MAADKRDRRDREQLDWRSVMKREVGEFEQGKTEKPAPGVGVEKKREKREGRG